MGGEFITLARVVKTQGRIGEVAVELHTDFPEKFAERRTLSAWMPDGTRRELRLEDFWPHKGRLVMKFAGVDSITAAEELIGCELQVPATERARLEAGAAYISDLVGCALFDLAGGTPKEVGTVVRVEFGTGDAPALVVQSGAKEYMVPFAEQYLKRLDTAGKRIEMELPEGLLDLDAPLGGKQQQR